MALDTLQSMQIGRFKFKGAAPGAGQVEAFLSAFAKFESNKGTPELVSLPEIPGDLKDWRRWWAATKNEYGPPFELPAELRAPALKAEDTASERKKEPSR